MNIKQEVLDKNLFSQFAERRAYGRLLATPVVDLLQEWSEGEVQQPGNSPFDAMYAASMLLAGVVLAFAELSRAPETQATVDRMVELYRECLQKLARANDWDVKQPKQEAKP